MLRIENLRAGTLPPLSFSVADGECLAIEGPSGAGKTRLLRAIADLDEASGYLTLDGAARNEMPATEWRRKVRFAAAEPAWWTDTAAEVFSGEKILLERARKLASDLGLDAAILDRPLAQLSTGERQRLALARAMADQPRVLLLDEPTGALDPVSAALAEELIRYQALAGRSVILVSHDAAQVHRLADARLQLGPTPPGSTRQSKVGDA
ncbi:MAG: ATP-binding cassette domain-containing protein [Hyphomicrobiaceae bacterium]|nr:ATP-binding cassette domain-containing protein [Hyphomicrobiaceae bacterium]